MTPTTIKNHARLAFRAFTANSAVQFWLLAVGLSIPIVILMFVGAATDRNLDRSGTRPAFVAPTAPPCNQSTDCALHGRCTLRDGSCVIATAQDCLASQDCVRRGHCMPLGRFCVVVTEQDCLASRDCALHGHCALRDGSCVIPTGDAPAASAKIVPVTGAPARGTDDYCARTKDCAESGFCSWRSDTRQCALTSDEDCGRTKGCRQHGDCTLIFTQDAEGERDASCGPGTTADCRMTSGCRQNGECTWRGPGKGRGSCKR